MRTNKNKAARTCVFFGSNAVRLPSLDCLAVRTSKQWPNGFSACVAQLHAQQNQPWAGIASRVRRGGLQSDEQQRVGGRRQATERWKLGKVYHNHQGVDRILDEGLEKSRTDVLQVSLNIYELVGFWDYRAWMGRGRILSWSLQLCGKNFLPECAVEANVWHDDFQALEWKSPGLFKMVTVTIGALQYVCTAFFFHCLTGRVWRSCCKGFGTGADHISSRLIIH